MTKGDVIKICGMDRDKTFRRCKLRKVVVIGLLLLSTLFTISTIILIVVVSVTMLTLTLFCACRRITHCLTILYSQRKVSVALTGPFCLSL